MVVFEHTLAMLFLFFRPGIFAATTTWRIRPATGARAGRKACRLPMLALKDIDGVVREVIIVVAI